MAFWCFLVSFCHFLCLVILMQICHFLSLFEANLLHCVTLCHILALLIVILCLLILIQFYHFLSLFDVILSHFVTFCHISPLFSTFLSTFPLLHFPPSFPFSHSSLVGSRSLLAPCLAPPFSPPNSSSPTRARFPARPSSCAHWSNSC